MAQSLRFVVEVAADQATTALNAVSTALNQADVRFRQSMLGLGGAARGAGKEVQTLGEKMATYAREQRREAGAARFFVQEIASIVPVTGHAQVALTGVASILAGGLGFGAVVAGITTFVQWLRVSAEEQKKAREEVEKHERALGNLAATAAIRRMRASFEAAGGDAGRIDRAVTRAEQESEIQNALNVQLERQAAARREIARWTAELAAIAEKYEVMPEITDVAHRIRAEEKLTEARRQEADATHRVEEAERALKEARRAGAIEAKLADTKFAEAQTEKTRRDGLREEVALRKQLKDLKAEDARVMDRINAQLAQEQQEASERAAGQLAVDQAMDRHQKRRVEKAREAGEEVGRTYVEPMVHTFVNGLAQMLQGQMTFRDLMRSIWQTIVQIVVNALSQMISQYIVTSLTQVSANAAVAGSGAAASQAGIPVVGPGMAMGAMAAMVAAVLALGALIPSAAMGFDIPAGVNPLTQLHEKEMVLPAEHAETIRSLKGRGAGGITVNISGIDGPSIGRVVRGYEFQSEMRRASRRRG